MENNIYIKSEIAEDILNDLSARYNTKLKDIHRVVGSRVYEIVVDCDRLFTDEGRLQMDLFDE